MYTRIPIGVRWKNRFATYIGMRTQPWLAGWVGTDVLPWKAKPLWKYAG